LQAKCPTGYYKKVSKATPYTAMLILLISLTVFTSIPKIPRAEAAPHVASSLRVLVIPVEFPDQPHVKAAAEIEDLIFDRLGLYLSEASYGRVHLEGMVLNWVKAPRGLSFYGCDEKGIDWRMPTLVKHAVHLAAGDSRIRMNIGGYDLIVIVHAGQGQETSRRSTDIWSAYWTGLDVQIGGYRVDSAVILPEYEGGGVDLLGPYAHEILHALGLRDAGGSMGRWDVMGRGAYYGDPPGSSPAHPSAYNKIKLGWIEPSEISIVSATSTVALPPLELTPYASVVKIPLQRDSYYLIEFRDHIGFDRGLPSPALVITLVEEGRDVGEWKVNLIPVKDSRIGQGDAEDTGRSLILPMEDNPMETVYFADAENRITVKGYPNPDDTPLMKIEILFN
jgi:immune inhibitor A